MATNKVPNRHNWVFGSRNNILKDKELLIDQYIRYMLARTQSIFEYKNLPESLPQRQIELITQTSRFTIWKRVKGELYVFWGGLGGIPNEYYEPTKSIVANPYLKFFEQMEIDKDCVVMWNDSLHIGLMPMFEKYASLLAESDISMRFACINSRIERLVIANDDNTKESAVEFFKKIENGDELGVIGGDAFFEGLKSEEYMSSRSSTLKDLVEFQQYLKASWFNDLGINANFNMKREAINESEASMNEDALLPLIDDMMKQRKLAVEKINKMFGANIEVDFSSSWKKIRNEIIISEELQKDELQKEDQPQEELPEDENKKEDSLLPNGKKKGKKVKKNEDSGND